MNFEQARFNMVEQQVRTWEVLDERVLELLETTHREDFVPVRYRKMAFTDMAIPLDHGQNMMKPVVEGRLLQALELQADETVLEIGTGSGYQTVILAELGVEVYSIEIVPQLAEHTRKVLIAEGYDKVKVFTGDGYKGKPAPYDAIIVTCAPENIPQALIDQLRDGGRMILPVGPTLAQRLVILRKKGGKVLQEKDIAVTFVPMVQK